MTKKSYSILHIIITLLTTLLISLIIYNIFFIKKIVYVDNLKVFNEFKMTKELIKTGDKVLLKQKRELDSLYSILNTSVNETTKQITVEKIIEQKQIIEDFQKNYSSINSNKIWNRINDYLKEYSKESSYDLVIGYQTSDGLFCGKEDLDVTNEVVEYVNYRYEGLK